MRIITLFTCSLLLVSCFSVQPEALDSVEILEIKPRYMETEEFKRISEYMTGEEYQGDRTIIRTQPDNRNGFYFVLILNKDIRRLPHDSKVIGEAYVPHLVDLQTYTFNLPPERASSNELFLGITGTDWVDPQAVPSAWRFTIKDGNDRTIGTAQNYLWSL